MKNNGDIELVVTGTPTGDPTDTPAFVPLVTEGIPSIAGNGPALLFDLDAWGYQLEPAAEEDIDKADIEGLEEIEQDLSAQWLKTVDDSLQVHAAVVATSAGIAKISEGINGELSDTVEADSAGLVQNGKDWAESNYNEAIQEMPAEAWQPPPAMPAADPPQPDPPAGGDNTGAVLEL